MIVSLCILLLEKKKIKSDILKFKDMFLAILGVYFFMFNYQSKIYFVTISLSSKNSCKGWNIAVDDMKTAIMC